MAKLKNVGGKIIGTVLLLALLFCVAVGAIEMPVAAEGEELTRAQQAIVWLKTHIDKLYLSLGVSGSVVVSYLITAYSKVSSKSADDTSAFCVRLENYIKKYQDEKDEHDRKQTQAISAILDAFCLSELPVSVREKLEHARAEINGRETFDIDNARKLAQVVVEKIAENKQEVVQEQTAVVGEINGSKQDVDTAPVLFN